MEMKQTPKVERRMTRLQARLSAPPQNPSNLLSNTPKHVKSPSSENERRMEFHAFEKREQACIQGGQLLCGLPNAGVFMNTVIDYVADGTISVTTTPLKYYSRKLALNPTAQHESYKKCKTDTPVHASPVEAKVADSHPTVNASEPMQGWELNVAENFEERPGEHAYREFLQSEGHSSPKLSLVEDHLRSHVRNHVESLFSCPVPIASMSFLEAGDYNAVEWRTAGVSDIDDIVTPSNVCTVNTEAFPPMVSTQNGTVATPSSNGPSINPPDALPHAPNGTTSDQGQVQMGNVTVTSNAVEDSCCTGLTEMMNMGAGEDIDEDEVEEYPPLVRVHGYRVKEEWAPVLRNIIDKHGDIAADCIMTAPRLRSAVLEEVCQIVEKFQAKTFRQFTQDAIEEALTEVSDVGKTGMGVSWLQERLEDILEAKQLVKDSNMGGHLKKLNQVIEVMEKEMEVHKDQLKLAEEKRDAARTEYAKLKGSISKAKYFINNLNLPFDGLL